MTVKKVKNNLTNSKNKYICDLNPYFYAIHLSENIKSKNKNLLSLEPNKLQYFDAIKVDRDQNIDY